MNDITYNRDDTLMSGMTDQKVILSIMILTRNRKQEVLRALQSCMECTLPSKTEFIIVDNASEDGTQEAVAQYFHKNPFEYSYQYLPENLGAAAGRNEGYKKVNGRYVYFMDDDAYIDGPKEIFFSQMISYLQDNPNVFGITTTIYDTEIQGDRSVVPVNESSIDHCEKVQWFHCGSVLLDKQRAYDQEKLFLQHVFKGMPELYPALKSYFDGKYIVEMKKNRVIHEPSSHTRPDKKAEAIYHYTGGLHAKLFFYPLITFPILYIMFCLRIIKHLGFKGLPGAFSKLAGLNKFLVRETVPISELIGLVRDFGYIAVF